MANARGGQYQSNPASQGGGGQGQFPAYAVGGGQYYGMGQQQQQQLLNYQQYYGAHQPQQSLGYGAPPQNQQPYPLQTHQGAPRMGGPSQGAPPPPPPPPPGEVFSNNNKTAPAANAMSSSSLLPPLLPPPLPPMFPWMSPALAASMTSSRFGKPFAEQASNLPFVPIIVNDSDLAKMTENVIKEVESNKSQQLQYYKDVLSQDLPQALKDMFQPLYCKLCVLTLSSPVVAKDHYSGKRHKKSVEAWFVKYPNVTPKPGPLLSPSDGGNLNLPINGYITRQQNPSNRNGAAVPPPPSLAQPLVRHPSNSMSQSQQQMPQPLIPGLIGRQQQQQTFDRKRPAAPPPPPSIANTQPTQPIQQKPTSIAEKLLRLSSISCSTPNPNIAPAKQQPPPPPTFCKIGDSPKPKGNAGFNNAPNSTKNNQQQGQFKQQQQKQFIGPVWEKPSTSANSLYSADFQQQPAKKPKLEEKGDATATAPVASPKPSPTPQPKGTLGTASASATTASTSTASTPTPPPVVHPPQKSDSSGAKKILPSKPQNSNNRPPPGAKGLCQICNVHLSSPIQAEQHFKGKNHAARMAALEEEGETNIPPPIMPVPGQPKPPSGSEADNFSSGPMNNRPSGNQPQFNDMPGRGSHRGGRGGGGGPRQPHPSNNNARNNNFNNQRHNNNNNRFNRNNRNKGPRF